MSLWKAIFKHSTESKDILLEVNCQRNEPQIFVDMINKPNIRFITISQYVVDIVSLFLLFVEDFYLFFFTSSRISLSETKEKANPKTYKCHLKGRDLMSIFENLSICLCIVPKARLHFGAIRNLFKRVKFS